MAGQHHRSDETDSHTRAWANPTARESPNRSAGEGELEDRATREGDVQRHNDRAAQEAADDRIRRAEELVDRIGMRVGEVTSFLGHQLLKLGARVREEAEDIWAEAQNLRRGSRP
jgi:hypothetical protein